MDAGMLASIAKNQIAATDTILHGALEVSHVIRKRHT